MNTLETENIQSVASTLSLIVSFEDSQMWEAFADIYSIWDEKLRTLAIAQLPEIDRQRLDEYNRLCATISTQLSLVLSYEDKKLLKELQTIRHKRSKYLLSVVSRLLSKGEQVKLRKMIILQNITNGEESLDRPWEQKKVKVPPKRKEFTKELLAEI